MARIQFRLIALLGVVVCLAIYLASYRLLKSESHVVVPRYAMMFVMIVSVASALSERGSLRAFWVGFSLLCSLHLLESTHYSPTVSTLIDESWLDNFYDYFKEKMEYPKYLECVSSGRQIGYFVWPIVLLAICSIGGLLCAVGTKLKARLAVLVEAVAFCGVCFAIRRDSQWSPLPGMWIRLLLPRYWLMTVLVLAVAGVLSQRGPRRAFWIGFAISCGLHTFQTLWKEGFGFVDESWVYEFIGSDITEKIEPPHGIFPIFVLLISTACGLVCSAAYRQSKRKRGSGRLTSATPHVHG